MGGCTAPYCNNSSEKGYIMKIFPRDPERRMIWAKNAGFTTWRPTDNSYLCEVHFAQDMWENRADKKPKLKPNAVPTIFGYFIKQKQFQEIFKNKNTTNISNMTNQTSEVRHSYVTNLCSKPPASELDKLNEKYEKLEKIASKLMRNLIIEKRKTKALRSTVQQLQDKLNNDKYKKALERIFAEDQIRALFTKNQRVRYWSDSTILRALQLKLVCGIHGYEDLLEQGMPLPSLRTLHRKLGKCTSSSDPDGSRKTENFADSENCADYTNYECISEDVDYCEVEPIKLPLPLKK